MGSLFIDCWDKLGFSEFGPSLFYHDKEQQWSNRVFGIVSGQVVLFCFLLAVVLLAFFGPLLFTSCVLLALFVLYNICFLLIKKKKNNGEKTKKNLVGIPLLLILDFMAGKKYGGV